MRLHGRSNNCEELTIRHPRSYGKAPDCRAQHTREFGQHPLRTLHVQHAEGAGDGIHALIGERDRLGVADTEIDAGVTPDRPAIMVGAKSIPMTSAPRQTAAAASAPVPQAMSKLARRVPPRPHPTMGRWRSG